MEGLVEERSRQRRGRRPLPAILRRLARAIALGCVDSRSAEAAAEIRLRAPIPELSEQQSTAAFFRSGPKSRAGGLDPAVRAVPDQLHCEGDRADHA